MTTIDWSSLLGPYTPNARGGKLLKYKVIKDPHGEGQVLLLCGPAEVADEIKIVASAVCVEAALSDDGKKTWTHAFRFAGVVPASVTELADLLKLALSIPSPGQVDRCMALDWYTVPNEDDELIHTRAGELINFTKHASHPDYSNSRNCRREMIATLADFIQRHPRYSVATAMVAAPGHLADGNSFGEKLAREVAAKAGISFVESTSPGGPRERQFDTKQDLSEAFTVNGTLSGTVIVLDDVYQSGGSATGAAAAARRAGATTVVFLAVARTIRK
ncbi:MULTISPECIES: hypothetical protein [unclassified Leifsonia]|uniref:hypothetical protein n=1 Tax=unclassified Leifsonia TaxID=2663824 RepID=UPI0006F313DB|nr:MULTISPECIES: hypothetical protein [unclassified Leifsonia]KQX07332.1 hypothetical protein ASC59_06015 [Leifsonia sp. Root1293]KRA11614.1 hypothetical protein ASD61_06015 [Leifsonia sp. Root60]